MKKLILVTGLILCAIFTVFAQEQQAGQVEYKVKVQKNLIKFNLTGLILKNYSLQYERVLTKRVSIAFAYRTMPTSNLPFKDQILKRMGEDDVNARNAVEGVTLSNKAYTPEIRFYLGKKGYGRGFYIAPFYRYATYEGKNIVVDYDYQDSNDHTVSASVTMAGNITANTYGLLFGAQWALCKFICLDWWILGPHYGTSKGDITGIPSQTLSQEAQDEIYQKLTDLDIPLVKQTVQVSPTKVNMSIDGPWGGLRAGISIGIKF